MRRTGSSLWTPRRNSCGCSSSAIRTPAGAQSSRTWAGTACRTCPLPPCSRSAEIPLPRPCRAFREMVPCSHPRTCATAKREAHTYSSSRPRPAGYPAALNDTTRRTDAERVQGGFSMAGREKIWGRSKPSTRCPFCGNANTAFVKVRRSEEAPGRYVVRCCSCGAQGPSAPTMGEANACWQAREDGDGR